MAFDYALSKFIALQDPEACAKARAITRDQICDHPSPDFRIRIIDDPSELYLEFALDIISRIQEALAENRNCVLILPVALALLAAAAVIASLV